jgi:hypothetical protein
LIGKWRPERYASEGHGFMKSGTSLTLELLKQKSDPAEIVVKLALRKALLGCESVLDVDAERLPQCASWVFIVRWELMDISHQLTGRNS